MIVAAVEHAVRRFRSSIERAIAEAATGFSDREAGDFLTDSDLDDPETLRAMQTPAASATADRPAGVSTGQQSPVPSVGHPTSAEPPAAVDDPAGTPQPAGSPNFESGVDFGARLDMACEFFPQSTKHCNK
jgi:hypothetical protein